MMKANAPYAKYKQNRHKQSAGFTMAELLVVVAIIGILAGVSFVAVQQHEKTVTQLQYDTIAREIFVAAQNHLTLAKSENYRQNADLNTVSGTFFGRKETAAVNNTEPGIEVAGNASTTDTPTEEVYYFTSGEYSDSNALSQILPFGAIELVSGGNYIIRYQPKAAKVLDVFYWTNDRKFGISSVDYSTAKDYSGIDKKSSRAKYENTNGILGWCGGDEVVSTGDYLDAPVINVINDALLLVEVTDINISKATLSPQLKLLVTGEKSGAKVAIPLVANTANDIKSGARIESKTSIDGNEIQYRVVLDDITNKNLHFSEIVNGNLGLPEGTVFNGNRFVPGENITVQAVAYSNDVLTSVAYSGEWTTNSLFGEVPVNKTTTTIADGTTITSVTAKDVYITNIRHLENLNNGLSGVAYGDAFFNDTISAVQTVDLNWNYFKTSVNELKGITPTTTAINIYNALNLPTNDDCFLPVSTGYVLVYNGQNKVTVSETTLVNNAETTITKEITENHSITGIKVDDTTAQQLTQGNNAFGAQSSVNNVLLDNAGLFGTLSGATIKNLALIDTSVTLTSGNAGILAGKLIKCMVENVIAYNSTNATTVNVTASSGSAGGLIGSISAETEVKKCAASVIVSATEGNAGGLVGSANGCTVTGCYAGGHTIDSAISEAVVYDSTATNYNVTATEKEGTGGIAGGLIGDATATTINYCYSTCSATGTTVGGLIGTGNGAITHSYCTGLVKSTIKKTENTSPIEGAFAGTYTGTASGCMYFEIVNEREETYTNDSNVEVPTGGYTYLPPVSGSDTVTGVSAFDETATTFNAFSFDKGVQGYSWQNAMPYNQKLKAYYGENTTVGSDTVRVAKYILKTVAQLGQTDVTVGSEKTEGTTTTIIPDDFVATHYGDWPAPEIFVSNTAG